MPGVAYVTPRVNINGLIMSSSKTSNGVIVGVDPDREQDLLTEGLVARDGGVLARSASTPHPIFISTTTAKLYGVRPGDSLTLVCQSITGSYGVIKFTVSGIFKPSAWKESYSYILVEDAQALGGIGTDATQLKVMLDDPARSDATARAINEAHGFLSETVSRDWRTAGEFFLSTVLIIEGSLYGICAILFVLVVTILLNSITMSIHEQTSEIGVLMAMGTKRGEIDQIYLAQTALLVLFFGGLGGLTAQAISVALGRSGIPAFNDAVRMGFGADRAFPDPNALTVLAVIGVLLALALLVTVFPLRRIHRLDPVQAITRPA